jgi:hypothetical protein
VNRYYNLPDEQARWLATGNPNEMVIVSVLKEQPPEGYQGEFDSSWRPVLPHPIDAKVLLRETWDGEYALGGIIILDKVRYKADRDEPIWEWRSPAAMPPEAIRHKDWMVTGVRVCRVQEIKDNELYHAYFGWYEVRKQGDRKKFRDWFDRRYSRTAKKWTWDQNPYVEIAAIERSR